MIDILTTITTAAQTYTPPSGSIVLPSKTYFGQRGVAEPVPLVQYDDTLPIIAAALYLGDQPYTVPDGAAVNIRMAKGDGTYVYNPALGVSEDRQTAYIAVTYQMTVIAGSYCPILELVASGDVAGTSELPLQIAENPVPEDAIASTDEYKTIQQLAAEVNQAAQIVTENLPGIQYIQQNADTITAVAQNSENITTVGENIGNVNSVAQNLTPIQTAATNIPAIQAAPTAASNAAASATLAESWAVGGTGTRAGENTDNAQYYAAQAQQVAQGALGWYATPQALQSAHPTGQNGQWAIIGTTDTIWTWDSDTSAWVNSGAQVDLSNYYTKAQADSAFAPKSHASTLATYGTGSSAVYGHVKLSDTPGTSDTSGGTAATPKCVQDAVNSGAEVETLSVTSLASEVTVNSSTKCFKCANLLVLFLSFTVSSSLTNWQAIAKISGVSGAIPNYGKVATIATGVVPAEDIRITADGTVEAYIFGSSYTHSYTGILITFCQD